MDDKMFKIREAYLNEKPRHESTAFGSNADRWASHERVTVALAVYMDAVRQEYEYIISRLSRL